jgi:hypothetical protein
MSTRISGIEKMEFTENSPTAAPRRRRLMDE